MKKTLVPIGVILLAAFMRLLPHVPNVTPIAAMALFGGAYINKRFALVVPLLAMFISDFFLGFHPVMPFVYGSFLLSGFLGLWLRKRKSPFRVFSASVISSILFYLITNFGVWFMGGLYPKTMSGLITCFVMALPFFRNTIVGDLMYTTVLFGGFELIGFYTRRLAHLNAPRT
ncbi:MAG: hypothetical protein KGJ07_07945 [Patescibacteria group bacterium]|nr:hypothetical protein [Patescibacteria group bacterium]MDE2588692.1 hypothetical protein [Patescibacteria group bacterium]